LASYYKNVQFEHVAFAVQFYSVPSARYFTQNPKTLHVLMTACSCSGVLLLSLL